MILIIILTLSGLYFQLGLLVLSQILLWSLVFILSNTIIDKHPNARDAHIIRIMSILIIILIFYDNLDNQIWLLSVLPLSFDKITYLDDLNSVKYVDYNFKNYDLYFFDTNEICAFLNILDENSNYVLSLEFIPDVQKLHKNNPQIFLSRPIIVNKSSYPDVISLFLHARLLYLVEYLNDSILKIKLVLESDILNV
jgi:hypothetical protein